MKLIQFLLILGLFNLSFAQEKKLLKTLNQALKKEVKHQLKSPNFNGDTIRIVEPFKIDGEKNLTFTIKKTSPSFSGYQIVYQKIPLKSIKKIGKDINVFFEAAPDEVSSTIKTIENGITKDDVFKDQLFFLYLYHEKNNESLGTKIQSELAKAGYMATIEFWAD